MGGDSSSVKEGGEVMGEEVKKEKMRSREGERSEEEQLYRAFDAMDRGKEVWDEVLKEYDIEKASVEEIGNAFIAKYFKKFKPEEIEAVKKYIRRMTKIDRVQDYIYRKMFDFSLKEVNPVLYYDWSYLLGERLKHDIIRLTTAERKRLRKHLAKTCTWITGILLFISIYSTIIGSISLFAGVPLSILFLGLFLPFLKKGYYDKR